MNGEYEDAEIHGFDVDRCSFDWIDTKSQVTNVIKLEVMIYSTGCSIRQWDIKQL